MPLTDKIIDNTEPHAKPFKLFDGGGLHVLINPNGSKYWRLKFYFAGIEKSLSLGVYPHVSLGIARARRAEARRLLRAGINPSEVRQAEIEVHKSQKALAMYRARVVDELRSLRVSVLPDRTIELRMGLVSLTLTDSGTRHLQHLLSRLPKRKGYADATN